MAINKKLIHFKNKEKFEQELAKGNILPTSIVFIKNTQEIWTHGLYYSSLEDYYTKTEIDDKNSNLEDKLSLIFDDIYRILDYKSWNGFILMNSATENITYRVINYTPIVLSVEANVPTKVEVNEELTIMTQGFQDCSSLVLLDLSNLNTSQVTSINLMFYNCSSLTRIDGLSNWNTSKMLSMDSVFEKCFQLVFLDLNSWDTSNVTSMSNMFNNCSSLTSLDISNFDTSQVTTMYSMFARCSSLKSLNLNNFDTSKVEGMYLMFYDCLSLTSLNLSSFDISNITDLNLMFACCTNLQSLDLSSWNTSNVTIMNEMFSGCSSLTRIKCTQAFRDWCWEYQDEIFLPNALRQEGTGTWQDAMTNSPITLSERNILRDKNGLPLGWNEDNAPVASGTWEIVD